MENKEGKFAYRIGEWLGAVTLSCLAAILIGITIKILQWILF